MDLKAVKIEDEEANYHTTVLNKTTIIVEVIIGALSSVNVLSEFANFNCRMQKSITAQESAYSIVIDMRYCLLT